jgi:hypothetical protein
MAYQTKSQNDRLCGLIEKIRYNFPSVDSLPIIGVDVSEWHRNIKVLDENRKRKKLRLNGLEYKFDDGKKEVVRYMDEEFLFVNILESKRYTEDVIIGMPIAHMTNEEIVNEPELFARFFQKAIELINREYDGHAKIMMNHGKKYATVANHAHIQIAQSVGTAIPIPAMTPNK